MKLWDGLTPKRKDLSTARAAVHEDYLVLVQKIQELQTYCLNLTDNLQVMPNLDLILQEAKDKISEIKSTIDVVSLPQDVKDRLDLLEQQVVESDNRVDVIQLKRDMDCLKERVTKNQMEVLQLQSSFALEVKGFQNKVWGTLEKLKKETSEKLELLTEKMQHLDVQLDLQSSIEKFNQIKTR